MGMGHNNYINTPSFPQTQQNQEPNTMTSLPHMSRTKGNDGPSFVAK